MPAVHRIDERVPLVADLRLRSRHPDLRRGDKAARADMAGPRRCPDTAAVDRFTLRFAHPHGIPVLRFQAELAHGRVRDEAPRQPCCIFDHVVWRVINPLDDLVAGRMCPSLPFKAVQHVSIYRGQFQLTTDLFENAPRAEGPVERLPR